MIKIDQEWKHYIFSSIIALDENIFLPYILIFLDSTPSALILNLTHGQALTDFLQFIQASSLLEFLFTVFRA